MCVCVCVCVWHILWARSGCHPIGTLVDTHARTRTHTHTHHLGAPAVIREAPSLTRARTHAHTHTTWERTGSRPRGTLVDMEERARDRGERFWPLNELPAPGDIPANQQTVLLSVAVACVFTSDNAHCHSQWRAVLSRAVQSCSSSNCGQ